MNTLTVVGNLTADPELRFTPSGSPVANFTIAQTPRKYDAETKQWKDDKQANFFRSTVWNRQAENAAESLRKGTKVIAIGKLRTEKYTRNNEEVTSTNNLEIDHIGPSLQNATAVVTKNPTSDNGGNYRGGNNGGYNSGGGYNNGGGDYGNGGGGYGNNPASNDPPF